MTDDLNVSVQEAIQFAEKILPGEPASPGKADARWQAISRIGDSIESDPEVIWPFVARWGRHPQEDLRNAIATCLLEHLLEYHFEGIFPRVRELAAADGYFADTFLRCWKFGKSEQPENARAFDNLRSVCVPKH